MRVFRFGVVATTIAALAVLAAAPAHAAFTDKEFKCSATLAKSFSKLQATVLKTKAKCHNDDISGKADDDDACATLSTSANDKITKAKAKLLKKVAKDCASVCSISNEVACVTDLSCPPKHTAAPANNAIAERCLGKGGADPFSLRNLDWPGPYCASILGHAMVSTSDISDCVNVLVDTTAGAVDQTVYADLDEAAALPSDTAKCLSSISKAVSKAIGSVYVQTAGCRDTRRSANSSATPAYACPTEDVDTIDTIQGALETLSESIDKACDDTQIAGLTGLCAAGGPSPTTVAGAQDCLSDMVKELAAQERGYNRHVYSTIGMLNVTHPGSAAAYCGDGVVTATREEHTGVGEECDGDDTPCGAGSCIPPGDIFECTCDNVARERFIVNGDEAATDSDAGWLGASHDATHNDGFGYVNDLTNCTCNAFNEATCTSPSGDDICDIHSNMAPRCSDDLHGSDSCDDRGDGDGLAESSDCYRCDDNSINAGTWCANGSNANETLCQSQCFVDATGDPVVPQTACLQQSDCADGQTCKGRCDNTITCNRMTEGSPLPLISAANPVCVMLEYKTDITGTKNMVTGETEVHYTTRSLISLGSVFAQPCPVCAGTCIGGPTEGDSCYGRCDSSAAACLFDSDCVGGGDTACLESNAECTGGFCQLDLRCSEGLHAGQLCRPDSTTVLGVVSHDCPPTPNDMISGTGVTQPFGTVTTEAVEFPVGGPCTNPSWTNFDCPCPADSGPNAGVPTRPNACAAACDGGINEGKGCATGDGGLGQFTKCVGGADANLPCDADSDCASNNCSGQPRECLTGTTSLLGTACTTNGDCGGGGLCDDPCPGARCVPLCLQQGHCVGGSRNGDPCSTTDHCKECQAGNVNLLNTACDTNQRCNSTLVSGDGMCAPDPGVTCVIDDPEDGMCAGGPNKLRCTGPGFTTIPCTLEYGTCTSGHCVIGSPSLHGAACSVGTDCVENEQVPVSSGCDTGIDALPGTVDDIPGAGECEPRPEDCYFNNGHAEGGDTLNGDGSPTEVNINACFCTPANANPAVNLASGFGGPSRVRRQGVATVNVPSIP